MLSLTLRVNPSETHACWKFKEIQTVLNVFCACQKFLCKFIKLYFQDSGNNQYIYQITNTVEYSVVNFISRMQNPSKSRLNHDKKLKT